MAGLAEVGAGDMVGRFTGRLAAVVAADTVTGDSAVVEGCAGEAVGVVAVIAGIGALRVVGRFTQSNGAVVATDTGATNFRVIDLANSGPVICYVTAGTVITAVYMATGFRAAFNLTAW